MNARGVNEEGVMAFTSEQFHPSAIRLGKKAFSLDGVLHIVRLVPASFDSTKFVKDCRSKSGEFVPADERPIKERSENVGFVDTRTARPVYT